MKRLFLLFILSFLVGCEPQREPTITQGVSVYAPETSSYKGRFKLELVDYVSDSIAYGSRRGIYILTDTKTEQQFIGISGVGITQIGSHTSGKSTYSDEK